MRYCIYIVICPSYKESEVDYFKRPYVTNGFNIKIGTLHKYGRIYPVSFAQINKKMQDEMNHYVKFMMEVAERNIPKYVVDKARVKPDAISILKNKKVNDVASIEGPIQLAIQALSPTNVSVENKELLAIFKDQKEKLWSVSETRMKGQSQAKFATELEIQEAGFQARQTDIQEGLRELIKQELETLKDIIVNFWDGEYFFKVTGGMKPQWYVPQVINGMVINPLTDLLTGDYMIKVDISTALRPNRERRKKEVIEYLTWLIQTALPLLLQTGKTINWDSIARTAKDFGLNPENLFVDLQQTQQTPGQVPQEGQVI